MDLALFDLDNTLIAGDSDFEWAQFLINKGVLDRELYEARNLEFYEQYKAGTLDIDVFLDFQLQPMARYPRSVLDTWHQEFMSRHIRPIVSQKARILAVSYTHLDVYKRQDDGRPRSTSPGMIVEPSMMADFSTTPTAKPARSYSPSGLSLIHI